MSNKTLEVAKREYRSTVMTKAFIFGAIIMPMVIWTLAIAIPMLVQGETPMMKGTIAVVDESGQVAPLFEAQLSPEFLQKQHEQLQNMSFEDFVDLQSKAMGNQGGQFTKAMLLVAGRTMFDKLRSQPVHEIAFDDSHSPDQIDALKNDVRAGKYLALIHIRADALELDKDFLDKAVKKFISGNEPGGGRTGDTDAPDGQSGSSSSDEEPIATIVTERTMHSDNSDLLRSTLTRTIIAQKVLAYNIDVVKAQQVMMPPPIAVRNVTQTGEVKSNEAATMLVPFGFMMLLWISTFTGGQYLLTTTIEEKSSKVIEVLLSATSPMQLMTGKILGQGAVSLTMLVFYAGLAYGGLQRTEFGYLIEPSKFLIVAPYFIMAFFFIACLMASIGSAVNEMREAQALMGPVMLIVFLPLLAWMPIVQSPNGSLATISSFIPPMTPFVMALRLGSNQVIPAWQIVATCVVGFIAVWLFIIATAKIFRIGILMHGKAPNIATLIRWVRQS